MKYVPFTFEELPVKKMVELDSNIYGIEIKYNEYGKFFTILLTDENDVILYSTKLVYGKNVFDRIKGLPNVILIPVNMDDVESDKILTTEITVENFGKEVKLYVA